MRLVQAIALDDPNDKDDGLASCVCTENLIRID